jgi:hypothetical protein
VLEKCDISGKEIAPMLSLNVSTRTVMRALKKEDLTQRVRRIKPMPTEEQKRKRLEWCEAHRNWKVDDWKKVIWSDETSIQTGGHQKRKIFMRKSEQYHDSCVGTSFKSGRQSVMFWGAFTRDILGPLDYRSEQLQRKRSGEKSANWDTSAYIKICALLSRPYEIFREPPLDLLKMEPQFINP